MPTVLFVLPDEIMVPHAKDVLTARYPDIQIVAVAPTESVEFIQQYMAAGTEIVAARGGIALRVKEARLNVAFVEIPVSSFDVIRAINEAKLHGKSIAVVALTAMVLGIEFLADVLGVYIRHYDVMDYDRNNEKAVLQAHADGAEVILGGILSVKAAMRHNIPGTLIKMGKESLLQAAQEAMHLQEVLEAEKVKRGFLSTIVDYAHDGIITIDKEHAITAFNPIAQKLTRVDTANALGKPLETILPQLNINTRKDFFDHIIDINGTKVMCDSVPIMVNSKSFGAVVTLQEISKIQQKEAMIRKETSARGHTANFSFKHIIGKSAAIINTIETARDFAATNSSILISGETGTGKEVFAQSIHRASNRAKGPFVAINCAALPAQLLESELFGYVAGAFTGAQKEGKPGLFEIAHGGTIFLDELAEMDYVNQGRLLRFLQEKTVVRLGSFKVLPVDVRVIAATNKDLESLVRDNKFRNDLYYRLNVLRLEIPPLKERKTDIRLYAEAFLVEFSARSNRKFHLTDDAIRFLEEYSWPGNIRECRNLMERITATSKKIEITASVLSSMLGRNLQASPPPSGKERRLVLEIRKALADARGNYTAAAELLGVNRSTLWRRMQKFNIEY
jgi:transcriptional regulator with PAS, ATPase and Fis domain